MPRSNKIADWCTDARLRPVTCDDGKTRNFRAHGLRKAALRALAHAGCTGSEMMNVSGHSSLQQLQEYFDEGAGTSSRSRSHQMDGREGQNRNNELQTLMTPTYKPETKPLESQQQHSRLAIPAERPQRRKSRAYFGKPA
ncbi:hypothetical protein [Bradyrhizobium japonicum]|uniref:hypothetical protein n=1 Tax=Bradyrhizobium japonicum TaxID=375 RepID=UPI00126A6FA2|nr:hypothetical protein [Bradyrhizobium japonicum]